MASIFIGLNRGDNMTYEKIQEGASTNSTDFELRIDTGKSSTREDAVLAMEQFIRYLIDGRTSVFPM